MQYLLVICFTISVFFHLPVKAESVPFFGVNGNDVSTRQLTDAVMDAKQRYQGGDIVFLYIDQQAIDQPLLVEKQARARVTEQREAKGQLFRPGAGGVDRGFHNLMPGLNARQQEYVRKRYRIQSLAQSWRFVDKTRQQKLRMKRELQLYANRFNLTMWRLLLADGKIDKGFKK